MLAVEPRAEYHELSRTAIDRGAYGRVDGHRAQSHHVGGGRRDRQRFSALSLANPSRDFREPQSPFLVEKYARGRVVKVAYVRRAGVGERARMYATSIAVLLARACFIA